MSKWFRSQRGTGVIDLRTLYVLNTDFWCMQQNYLVCQHWARTMVYPDSKKMPYSVHQSLSGLSSSEAASAAILRPLIIKSRRNLAYLPFGGRIVVSLLPASQEIRM